MSLHVRDGGSWKTIGPQDFWVRDAGSWKAVQEGYVRSSGAWKSFYQRSDPLTVNLYPSWSHGYMYAGGQCRGGVLSGVADDDVIQGYWETSQGTVPGPAGTWSHVSSVISFSDIDTHLATRPVIKSATLRLTLLVGYGGDPKETNVILGSLYTDGNVMATWPHTDTWKGLQDTGALFTANGQTKTFSLNAAMRDALEIRSGIALHDYGHSTDEAGKRANRAIFEGANAASHLRPQLSVTLDYI